MSHFLNRCVCGNVLDQCRCPGPKVENTISPCECDEPGWAASAEPASDRQRALAAAFVAGDAERVRLYQTSVEFRASVDGLATIADAAVETLANRARSGAAGRAAFERELVTGFALSDEPSLKKFLEDRESDD